MSGNRYSNMGPLTQTGFLWNALDPNKGKDGDAGAAFPRSDAEDLSRGARFIPQEVTLARRRGEKVNFFVQCGPCCWYWQLPDGTKIFHFDPIVYTEIARANGKSFKDGRPTELAGRCPQCKNQHTNGGKAKL